MSRSDSHAHCSMVQQQKASASAPVRSRVTTHESRRTRSPPPQRNSAVISAHACIHHAKRKHGVVAINDANFFFPWSLGFTLS